MKKKKSRGVEIEWWYALEIKEPEGWAQDGFDFDTLKEARARMVRAHCHGYEVRIVQHYRGWRPFKYKDFRD